jgi:hypothetical protein
MTAEETYLARPRYRILEDGKPTGEAHHRNLEEYQAIKECSRLNKPLWVDRFDFGIDPDPRQLELTETKETAC